MQKKFTPMGDPERHDALQVQVDGWRLGELVIGAADVPKLLNGDEVTIHFVQQRLARSRSSVTPAAPDLPVRQGGGTSGSRAG